MSDSLSNRRARPTPLGPRTAPAEIGPDGVPTTAIEDVYVLSVRRLVEVLLRRIWVILLSTILLVGLVVGYSVQQTPVYAASIKILVGQRSDMDPVIAPPIYDLQQWAVTMAEAIDSRRIAAATIERLNQPMAPDVLLANLTAEAALETQFIEVTYTDSDRARAQQVANAVGAAFSDNVKQISPEAEGVTVMVWEKAAMPISPISPNPLRNGVLALAVGCVIGIGLAFLMEHLDDSWRSPEELAQVSGLPTFGVIPSHEAISRTMPRKR